MMRRFFYTSFIIFLILFFGCTTQRTKKGTNQPDNKTIEIKNNKLLSELTEKISIKDIDRNFNGQVYSLDKTIHKYEYDSLQVDTIYNYKSIFDTVSIFKSVSNEFILNLSIKSTSFLIGKNIKVGMTCDNIIKLLKIKETNFDTISIETDDETSSTNVLKLIFQDNKLKQITFYSIPD